MSFWKDLSGGCFKSAIFEGFSHIGPVLTILKQNFFNIDNSFSEFVMVLKQMVILLLN